MKTFVTLVGLCALVGLAPAVWADAQFCPLNADAPRPTKAGQCQRPVDKLCKLLRKKGTCPTFATLPICRACSGNGPFGPCEPKLPTQVECCQAGFDQPSGQMMPTGGCQAMCASWPGVPSCVSPAIVVRVYEVGQPGHDGTIEVRGFFPDRGTDCTGKRFQGTASRSSPDHKVAISGDCTGTLAVGWSQCLLSGCLPENIKFQGTLNCDCSSSPIQIDRIDDGGFLQ